MHTELRISGIMYQGLQAHLFPGDGKESVAIALCGRLETLTNTIFVVHRLIPIPIEDCSERSDSLVKWDTGKLIDVLELASKKNFSVFKFHSHPTGFDRFSTTDDRSDQELFESVFGWTENAIFHGSAIMLPAGKIFGRVYDRTLKAHALTKVLVVDDDIKYFFKENLQTAVEEFNIRTIQAFGLGTTSLLKQLSVAVVGCSGTGSPLVEQLFRLGFGKILLVDPDVIEKKNLNRIVNSKMSDALSGKFKVDVLMDAINAAGLGTEVEALHVNLYDDIHVIKRVASCDLIFGCMDSVDGRHLLNQISTFYLVPYFDLGVKLVADGKGSIEQIWGTVHYLQPGKSSLLTRGVYTHEDLSASSLHRSNPLQFDLLRKESYIKNVNVESPAVITINMQVASLALVEFLARIHQFRSDSNSESAITRISFTDSYIQKEGDSPDSKDVYLEKFVGRGDMQPLLNMAELN